MILLLSFLVRGITMKNKMLLLICYSLGESKILLACDRDNEASRRTIIKKGGVLQNEVADTVGLANGNIIQRYWLSIQSL